MAKKTTKKVDHKKRLTVKKDHVGNFTFTVHFGGIGKTAEEAWADVCEAVAMDGAGQMPDLPEISLDEQTPED